MNMVGVLKKVIVVLSLSAATGFAQTAGGAASVLPTVPLEQLIAAAREGSPSLKQSSITLDTARAALAEAMAQNGVSLGGTGDYSHQGNLTSSNAASSAGTLTSAAASGSAVNGENIKAGLSLTGPATSLGLTAQHSITEGTSNDQVSSLVLSGSQTVFDGYPGGRAAAAVQQADTVSKISQVTYDAAVKSALYQVKQAYYTLLGDQDTVVLRQAIAEQASENLALYQGLFTAQKATRLDVLQVQVTLTQAQLDVRTAQNTVVTDRRKLSLAVGWPLEKEYSVADSPLPDLPAMGAQDALDSAFQQRSELLTLEQDIAAAGIALSLQQSQGMPVVSLKASLGVGQDWTANVNEGAFTAGASIALPPIFDGGLQNAQVRQAANQIALYNLQQVQQRQSITIDVQNALFSVADTRDRHDVAGLNVQQAQGQYDLEKAKLAAGSGTTLDVLTAFSTLATARVGLEQAKSNYLLAVLNLYTTIGE